MSSPKSYPHDQETTDRVATAMGRLRKLAKEVAKRSLDKKLYIELEKRNVGTWEIESKNLPISARGRKWEECGGKRRKGDKKLDQIREHRDARIVKEILLLRTKTIAREEKEARRHYVNEKRRLETIFKDRGRQTAFKRLIRKIGRGTASNLT